MDGAIPYMTTGGNALDHATLSVGCDSEAKHVLAQ
jgi:hypothetical protein